MKTQFAPEDLKVYSKKELIKYHKQLSQAIVVDECYDQEDLQNLNAINEELKTR